MAYLEGFVLTERDLDDTPPKTAFATGLTIDNRTGVNMSDSDQVLRWVAVRGEIADWAIYIGLQSQSVEEIMRNGDKVYGSYNIERLVPCDTDALKRYRR